MDDMNASRLIPKKEALLVVRWPYLLGRPFLQEQCKMTDDVVTVRYWYCTLII
jgi:hypothetical protein